MASSGQDSTARKKAEEAALAESQVEAFTAAVGGLRRLLEPHGHAARIGAILKHGGYTVTSAIPAGVTLTIDWYKVPKGVHLAARAPVLVAAGSATSHASGPVELTISLTGAGRRLLRRPGPVPLTARGTLKPVTGPAAARVETFRLVR